MRIETALLSAVLAWACAVPALAGNGWSDAARPAAGPPRVIGSYVAGCLAGAVALPLVGDGYQVMRPSRRRYFGHPLLVAFVERMGRLAAERGKRLLIGDLGQPRGGPMPSGHRSHQVGLDVDIWFLPQARGRVLSPRETEEAVAPSMIRAAEGIVDSSAWSPLDLELLKDAAQAPEVERIFVNPIIKRALCSAATDHEWLNKVRPWWGHDEHFHVRLACPPGASQCEPQEPVPPGDGCDADLDHWVEEIRQAALFPEAHRRPRPPPARPLPLACRALLDARGARRP